MRTPGELKSSVNSGELSPALRGKVALKQYYSGALAMKNIEPVPQSGFTLMPGTRFIEAGASPICRKGVLAVDGELSYVLHFTPGQIRIYRNSVTRVATLAAGWVTSANIGELSFFGEANTFGVWHKDLRTCRIFRDESNDANWTIDNWPYADIPEVDLGGVYSKSNDKWNLHFRYTSDTPSLVAALTIEGNVSDGVTLLSSGSPVPPKDAVTADWNAFGADLETKARALPGMTGDLTINYDNANSSSRYKVFVVTFGGALRGSEYQLDASVLNTSDASVLASHITIGRTAGEALVSDVRGWFGGMSLFQDRAIYFAAKARKASFAWSKAGEYFDLDIKDQADNAARLEALRTITSETILHVLESKYLLIFTDKAEWFASNRTIERNQPVNFVRTTENGCRANCVPAVFEGFVWYVNKPGNMLFSTSYDDVSTSFLADPESLLATHLIAGVKRMAVQKAIDENGVSRLWMLRDDGRLICAIVIKAQEIMAVVEWIAADGGLVKEICVDGQQRLTITVQRGATISEEIMEEAEVNLFQAAMTVSTDLTGTATGLSRFNGKTVWGRFDGYIDGPFVVAGGQIKTDFPAATAQIGLWQPPNFESMPYVKVLPNNEILKRPGRVHTIELGLVDTESVAVGANGSPPKNVPLELATDNLSGPPVPVTRDVTVPGLNGVTVGPTIRITQVRPGLLTVRDYLPGVKL